MGDLFKSNGYRSAHSGTYWSAFRAVADEFDIEYQETSSLDKAVELLRNNNYIITSCRQWIIHKRRTLYRTCISR